MSQILSLNEVKYLGQIFSQPFCFIEGQYLAQVKYKIIKQMGCVDTALTYDYGVMSYTRTYYVRIKSRSNFSQPSSRFALVYQSFCSRAIADRL